MKNMLALVLSLTTAGLTILLVYYLNWDYLRLEISDLTNPDLSHLSFRSLFPVIFSHALAAFAGGIVLFLMKVKILKKLTWILGIALTCMGMLNVLLITYPKWFVIADILIYIPFAFAGSFLWKRNNSSQSMV